MSLKRTEMSDLWSRSRGPGTENIFRDFSCWSRLGSGPGLKATVYRTICHTATNVLLSWFMDMFLFFRLLVFIVKSFIPGVLINGGIIALKRTRRKFIPFLDKCHCLRSLLLNQGCQALLGRRLSILESRTPTIASNKICTCPWSTFTRSSQQLFQTSPFLFRCLAPLMSSLF